MVGIGWFCHFLRLWVPFDSPFCHFLRVLLPENVEFSLSVRLPVVGCGFFPHALFWSVFLVAECWKGWIWWLCAYDRRVEVSFGWFWIRFPMKLFFFARCFQRLKWVLLLLSKKCSVSLAFSFFYLFLLFADSERLFFSLKMAKSLFFSVCRLLEAVFRLTVSNSVAFHWHF